MRSDHLKQGLRANALKTSGNLHFAVFFVVLVGGIILLSLILRIFFLLKESKFDGSSHFALQLNEQRERVQYISFSPQDSHIGILTFKNAPFSSEIPIDAKTSSTLEIESKNLKPSLLKMMFDFRNQKEVNFVDLFRLFIFSQTIKENTISQILISQYSDKAKVDSIISAFFVDPRIQDEKLNIEVINATEVYGLGNKLANLISNTGANVVLVSTGDLKKVSLIEYSEPSYTVDKLSKILKFKKIKVSKKSLADITLIIGDNYVVH